MTEAPRRWHVYVVDLGGRVGTKPGKQRPCLAIQPDEFGEGGLTSTVILPLTTRVVPREAFPLRVRVPAGTCRLERDSDLLVDQILPGTTRSSATTSASCPKRSRTRCVGR